MTLIKTEGYVIGKCRDDNPRFDVKTIPWEWHNSRTDCSHFFSIVLCNCTLYLVLYSLFSLVNDMAGRVSPLSDVIGLPQPKNDSQ